MSSNRRLMRTGFVLLGIASFGGLLAMVLTGIERVHSGHGLDTYRMTWLIEFNWIGFVILLAVTVVALSIAAFLRYLDWREVDATGRAPKERDESEGESKAPRKRGKLRGS